jgi:hypothetical protein
MRRGSHNKTGDGPPFRPAAGAFAIRDPSRFWVYARRGQKLFSFDVQPQCRKKVDQADDLTLARVPTKR